MNRIISPFIYLWDFQINYIFADNIIKQHSWAD